MKSTFSTNSKCVKSLKQQFTCISLRRDNDITGVLDHTFCVEHNAYGEIIQHELKPNGKSIPVTQDTKKEYVRLYVNWRFLRGIEAQFLALQKGFNEVIPQHLLKAFDEKELEVLSFAPMWTLNCLVYLRGHVVRHTLTSTSSLCVQLIVCGLGKIDINDWKSNTRLKHCTPDSNIVKWFWKAVESFDEERRARLLQFVTGSSRVPLQGFKALQGKISQSGNCACQMVLYITAFIHT